MDPDHYRPTAEERRRRDEIMSRVLDCIRRDEKIKLPAFDPDRPGSSVDFALQSIEENEFWGSVGEIQYQLEGEDDLLHLIVVRADSRSLTAEEARPIAGFVFEGVPPGLIWLKPGEFSQHFYIGHDELLKTTVNTTYL